MKNIYISKQLSSACCVLLTGVNGQSDAAEIEPWSMNIGLANYIERDRNTGIEVIVNGSRPIQEDLFSIRIELDVITGATPNGATASNVSQTFTKSSGVGNYTVAANELPADDTHMDTRLGLNLLYADEIDERFSITYRSHLSMEFDYLSVGAGVELKRDFNQHNTSLSLGLDYEFNNIHPVGNVPIAFASMQPPGTDQPRGKASTVKEDRGISFGINQVLDSRSLFQAKYSYANASGYLTDPYKLLSVIREADGSTNNYLFEKRPDRRIKQSIFAAYKLYLSGDVLDLSYRYYRDDWLIKSNTLDIRYRKRLSDNTFIRPHLRYYKQSAADFYKHSIVENNPLPDYASADFRLAKFDAYTIGAKYGKQTGNDKEHSITVEYYTQRGNSKPSYAIGLQRQQDLFPTLQTLILFYNYAFKW